MRMLFVSCTTAGGSGRSQRDLVKRLVGLGHDVAMLVDDGRSALSTRWFYGQASDLAARLEGRPGGRVAVWLERRPGRRLQDLRLDGVDMHTAVVPQNAVERLITTFRPDVVVGNSLERLAWRRIHRVCQRHGIPTILYVREVDSLEHLIHGEMPDLLVANAHSLQEALHEAGYECEFVPSVTELGITATESTRRVVMFVNPLESHGVDMLWHLAESMPDVRFVVQQSRVGSDDDLSAAAARAARLPNVEVRPVTPPGPGLYGDTKVLIVPHRIDNRPRVILEAQANGIPVIASRTGGLVEAVGAGGLTVEMDDQGGWRDALAVLLTDEAQYDELARLAVEHSRREEVDPDAVARRFERLAQGLVDHRGE